MDNHIYNLVKALTKKSQSLWKYERYIKDAKDCQECIKLWKDIKKEDQKHQERIKEILFSHIKRSS